MNIKILRFVALVFLACIVMLALIFAVRRVSNFLSHRVAAKKVETVSGSIEKPSSLEDSLKLLLKSFEVADKEIRVKKTGTSCLLSARIPRGTPLEYTLEDIGNAAAYYGYKISDCIWQEHNSCCLIELVSDSTGASQWEIRLGRTERFASDAAQAAIIIEDADIGVVQTLVDICSFPDPLSISIPPSGADAIASAAAVKRSGKEVICELPFESEYLTGKIKKAEQLLINHNNHDINEDINHAIAQTSPSSAGFMGMTPLSPVYTNTQCLARLFAEFHKRGGYFIDHSRTISADVANAAKDADVPYAKVGFVISGKTEAQVQGELTAFVEAATHKSGLIAAAQPNAVFIKTLLKNRALFAKSGVKLVTVGAVLSH